ncbi:Hypothetical protein FKW44_002241 [Caligus rogercresseyi]|uniref:Uncharacterized protein n=1 Tax=Caligus rogercresseyi TaxID=217165 RepID=A0A7T8KKB9_CALRO|nr:Hypothetical protein FKW44_002241 [Caligus rogercresseyi]
MSALPFSQDKRKREIEGSPALVTPSVQYPIPDGGNWRATAAAGSGTLATWNGILAAETHLDRVGAAWRDVDPEVQYGRLKRDLIATYGLTKRQKVQKLLNMPPLGDELPLTRLFRMQALLPDKERKSELLYYLFIRMLPKSLVDKLQHADDLDVVGYATAADLIVRNSQSSPDDFSEFVQSPTT